MTKASSMRIIGFIIAAVLASLWAISPARAAVPVEFVLFDEDQLRVGFGTFLLDESLPWVDGSHPVSDIEVRLEGQTGASFEGDGKLSILSSNGPLRLGGTLRNSGMAFLSLRVLNLGIGRLKLNSGREKLRLNGNRTFQVIKSQEVLLTGTYKVEPLQLAVNTPNQNHIPEPGMFALFLAGLGALGIAARRSRRISKA